MDNPYLAGLRLAGRRVVVIGAGTVAQRRLPLLIASKAHIDVIAIEFTPAIYSLAQRWNHVHLIQRPYREGDLEQAWYAIAATNDPHVNAAIIAEAERHRIFCVRTDLARAGSAVTPATLGYEGLLIGVLAQGDHHRSAAIRSAIHNILQSGQLQPMSDENDKIPGGVALVGAGPGDPDLITVRGRRILAHADVVIADRLAPPELLAELPAHIEVIDAAKIPYHHKVSQEAINSFMIDRAKQGKFVVRLKGGDPFIFARGYEEVLACAHSGIPVTVVPGVTSATAVPAMGGIPLTHRAVNHEFVVVSGHLPPEHPKSLVNWDLLAQLSGTLVLLMGIKHIEQFANILQKGGRPADTPVAIIENGTIRSQRIIRTNLKEAAVTVHQEAISPPAIVVIGTVAAFKV